MEIKIGTWKETASREITRCPSYYAADTETLATVAGEYPLFVTFQTGYDIPMPSHVTVAIDTRRVSGRLYNGCGGVNFSHVELPAGEAVAYHARSYRYELAQLVAEGRVEIAPAFAWLIGGPSDAVWQRPGAPKTWAEVAALGKAA